MLDLSHILGTENSTNRQIIYATNSWVTWQRPRGTNFLNVFLLGGGGGGGAGATGNTTVGNAAGGGGGGSGAQYTGIFNLNFLPDTLYINVGLGGTLGNASAGGTGGTTYLSLYPITNVNYVLALAGGGTGGGTTTTNTQGTSGVGGTVTFTGMYHGALATLGWSGSTTLAGLSGQNGIAGGNASSDSSTLTLPTTGLVVTGGTGGGAVHNVSNTTGRASGSFVVPANSIFPAQTGGAGGTSTIVASNGSNGCQPIPKLLYFYGGTGGGGAFSGTGGTVGGNGGHGSYGCGGGGGGGSWATSTRSLGGRGGDGLCILTWW